MKNWKILVVEDEYDGQQVVSKLLKYMGIQSDIAATAEDAIEFLTQNRYTAAIIDLELPGMDGVQLIRQIRSDAATREMLCIMMTAYHSSQMKKLLLDAGADAYFPKPIDDTTFIRELERMLGS